VRIYLPTQVALYTKANSLCAPVTCTLTNNITVLIIDHQAHQDRHRREDKKKVGEHLTSIQNSPLGRSLTYDLGYSLRYPLILSLSELTRRT